MAELPHSRVKGAAANAPGAPKDLLAKQACEIVVPRARREIEARAETEALSPLAETGKTARPAGAYSQLLISRKGDQEPGRR